MFQEEDVTINMIPEMDHEDLKEIGVKTFGQRFKIIAAGKKIKSVFGTKEATIVEVRLTYSIEPVLVEETPDNFSITDILAANFTLRKKIKGISYIKSRRLLK